MFGDETIDMFHTITGKMWNRTNRTLLPKTVQKYADFLPGGMNPPGSSSFP